MPSPNEPRKLAAWYRNSRACGRASHLGGAPAQRQRAGGRSRPCGGWAALDTKDTFGRHHRPWSRLRRTDAVKPGGVPVIHAPAIPTPTGTGLMDGRIKSIKSGKLAGGQARVHRGGYRAQPSHCRYVPKPDGGQRPLGIAAPEDKIVQRATVELLNAIYEEDFLGFSHGFRAGRSQHDAPRVKPVGRRLTDALTVAIERTAVKWILDADIARFFRHGRPRAPDPLCGAPHR